MANILQKFLRSFGKKTTPPGKEKVSPPHGCESTKPTTKDSSYEVKIKKVKINNIKLK